MNGHYWVIGSVDGGAFKRLTQDTQQLIASQAEDTINGPLGKGNPEVNEGMIAFNGNEDRGQANTPFVMEPFPTDSGSVNTEGKPYDAIVQATLLRAMFQLGTTIQIASDLTWQDWTPGRELYADTFGTVPPHPGLIGSTPDQGQQMLQEYVQQQG